jgi:hypothetical protein
MVTVSEVYPGAGYEQVGEDPAPVEIPVPIDGAHAEVSFEDTRTTKVVHGYGIENHFEYTEDGWTLDNEEKWKEAE